MGYLENLKKLKKQISGGYYMANCIKCGADVPKGAERCEYCGAVVELPKAAPVAAHEPEVSRASSVPANAPRFRVVSVGLMVVFTLITIGLYLSFWFFLRRKEFAEISPKAGKASGIFVGLLGVHIFYLLAFLGFLGSPDQELLDIVAMLSYALWGAIIYAAFIVRAALAELAELHGRGMEFAGSILWTLVFNAFYLQSQINRMVDARLLNRAP